MQGAMSSDQVSIGRIHSPRASPALHRFQTQSPDSPPGPSRDLAHEDKLRTRAFSPSSPMVKQLFRSHLQTLPGINSQLSFGKHIPRSHPPLGGDKCLQV